MFQDNSTTQRMPLRLRLIEWLDRSLTVVAIVAIISLLIDAGGFNLPAGVREALYLVDVGIVVFVICSMLFHLILTPLRVAYLRRHWPEFLLLGFFLGLLLLRSLFLDHQTLSAFPGWLRWILGLRIPFITKSYLAIVQTYITAHLILQGVRNSRRVAYLNLKPAQILLLSFLLVISLGTFLLATPRALKMPSTSVFHTLLDALFTATSATCVTGLVVRDTGTHFSQFGQGVILTLIQIGGLGLMTMTAFFALVLGQGMGIRERLLIGDILSAKTLGQLSHLIVSILMLTFIFEFLGAVALYVAWDDLANLPTHSQRFYYAMFHAVSAFCNAGFGLLPDSLVSQRSSISVNLIVTSLIIVGGLGFTVNSNLLRYGVYGKLLRRRQEQISLHTKLVILMTPLLIVVGMLLFLVPEWRHSLAGMGVGEKLLASYFQSVTTRTAGFNTVDTSRLLPATYFLIMLLMFIGASPGSTGGGIKTSTFATLMGSLWATLRGKERVEMFHRTIPEPVVQKALAITVTSLVLLAAFGFLLLWTQDAPPIQILFEMISAFGTVGLSAGLTSNLTVAGKVMIIFMMFIGRIGPLTLALAIGQRSETGSYRYPNEQVMIG